VSGCRSEISTASLLRRIVASQLELFLGRFRECPSRIEPFNRLPDRGLNDVDVLRADPSLFHFLPECEKNAVRFRSIQIDDDGCPISRNESAFQLWKVDRCLERPPDFHLRICQL